LNITEVGVTYSTRDLISDVIDHCD